MKNKKVRLYTKLILLILCLLIVIRIITLVIAKYESNATSNAKVDIALYLLNEDYKTMNLNLAEILPQNNSYFYTFLVGNTDGKKVAEVNLNYDLTITTTTNLPIKYELYIDENSQGTNMNAIKSNVVEKDEYGTYFRKITTETQRLDYTKAKTNTYTLVLNFPAKYNTEEYQDIIDNIEIAVKSEQILD